jgi:hypothetical protein
LVEALTSELLLVGELFGAQLLLAEKTWAIALQKPGAAKGPLPFTTGKKQC